MKKIVALLILLASFGVSASETSKQARLVELINVMDMDSMIDSMYSQMGAMMQNMATQMGVQPSEQAIFEKYNNKMMAVLREDMNWKKMEPLVLDIYDKNLSEKEISDMLVFYKSESGKALLTKMPAIMQESMQMSQALMQNSIPKIQEIAVELTEELTQSREKKQTN